MIAEHEEVEKAPSRGKRSRTDKRDSRSRIEAEISKADFDLEIDKLVEDTAKASSGSRPRETSDRKVLELNEKLSQIDFKTPEIKRAERVGRTSLEREPTQKTISEVFPSSSRQPESNLVPQLTKKPVEEAESDDPANKKGKRRKGKTELFPAVKAAQLMPKSPVRPYQMPTGMGGGSETSPKQNFEIIPRHMRLAATASKPLGKAKTKLSKDLRRSRSKHEQGISRISLTRSQQAGATKAAKPAAEPLPMLPAPLLGSLALSPALSPPVPFAAASVKITPMSSYFQPSEDANIGLQMSTPFPNTMHEADFDDSNLGMRLPAPLSVANPGQQASSTTGGKKSKEHSSRLMRIAAILQDEMAKYYTEITRNPASLAQHSLEMASQLHTLADREKINRGIGALVASFRNRVDLDKLQDELQEMVLSVRHCKNFLKEAGPDL